MELADGRRDFSVGESIAAEECVDGVRCVVVPEEAKRIDGAAQDIGGRRWKGIFVLVNTIAGKM